MRTRHRTRNPKQETDHRKPATGHRTPATESRTPLAEEPQKGAKFTSIELNTLIRRREELVQEGLQDNEIARIIGKELGRSAGSLREKIRKLRTEGRIPDNPKRMKKKDYPDAEIDAIIRRRNSLVEEGLNDKAIATLVGKENGRSINSLYIKIRVLVKEGKIPENPNKMDIRKFSDKEDERLILRRAELISQGLTDKAIAKQLAKKMGRRVDSTYSRIRFLVGKEILPPNPNNLRRYSDEEIESLIKRRNALSENLGDNTIAEKIAKETGRSHKAVLRKILVLVKAGKLPENRNNNRPRGFLKILDDEGLVSYAKKEIERKGFKRRVDIKRKDSCLYIEVRERGLLDQLGLGRRDDRARYFDSMRDDELVKSAKAFAEKENIRWRIELLEKDVSLYGILKKRNLLERAGIKMRREKPRSLIRFSKLSDDQLIAFAKRLMKENNVFTSKKLRKSSGGLYSELWKRKLLDKIGLIRKAVRPWKDMSDDELIEFAQKVVQEKRISGKSELQMTDRGMYKVLWERKLLDRMHFVKKKEQKTWKQLDDEELIEYAKKFMKENGITGRHELEKTHNRLYRILRQRGLLDMVGFEAKRRNWREMTDDQVVEHAIRLIEENELRTKTEFLKKNYLQYKTLLERGLLDRLDFEELHRNWNNMSDDQIVEYAKKLIEEKGIKTRTEIRDKDSGLYKILCERTLLDRIGIEQVRRKSRRWKQMNDEELVDYAKNFMKENGITGRFEFQKKDPGLRVILVKRGLFDLVFADIEQTQSERAIEQIIDFTASFGEKR